MAWRKRLYSIIEVADEDDKISKLYDWFMMLVIIVSIVPLAFKENSTTFLMLDKITVIIFIVDYVLRLATADIKMKKGALFFFPVSVFRDGNSRSVIHSPLGNYFKQQP